jgi:ATP-dependent DNA helicase 2 subunit 2
MIEKFCRNLKYKRKIVLITNGEGQMNADGTDQIAKKLKQEDIELVVL